MKKPLSIALSVSLILSVMAIPTFAADATSGASVVAPAPSTSSAPVKAPVKAPSGPNGTIDTSKLEAGTVYTVVSGDTFSGIAWKYKISIDALAKLNPQIKDINWIFVGDKVILKAPAPAPAPAPAAPAPAPAAPAAPVVDKAPYVAAEKEGYDWETKREEGYNYDMTHKISKGAADNASGKEWFEQMDFYEDYFTGKTVAEVETWFNKYTDSVNHRPYKFAYPDKMTDADKAATVSFTAEEKAMLVDVTTGATMSLQDGHSRFMESLQEAEAAKKVIAGNENLYLGIGNVANYRVSKSNMNVTTASVIFNKEGKIVDLEWDVLEITPTMFQWLPVQK